MPLYDFECSRCGIFIAARSISERDQLTRCDQCGRLAVRLVTAPRLNLMAIPRRDALFRNEKSRHEPSVSNHHACGSGCGCGSTRTGRQKGPPTRDAGKLGRLNASRTSKRPWMLGH